MGKTVYCFNEQKYFTHVHECQPSPLELGVYLMPPNTTEITPPVLAQNQYAKWNESAWSVENHTGKYLVKSGADFNTIVLSTFPPLVEYLDCPLEVENIGDCDIIGATVTFNQAKKDARLAAEAQARAEAEAELLAENTLRTAIKTRFTQYQTDLQTLRDQIVAVDPDSITNVATAKTVVTALKQVDINMGLLLRDVIQDLERIVVRVL